MMFILHVASLIFTWQKNSRPVRACYSLKIYAPIIVEGMIASHVANLLFAIREHIHLFPNLSHQPSFEGLRNPCSLLHHGPTFCSRHKSLLSPFHLHFRYTECLAYR